MISYRSCTTLFNRFVRGSGNSDHGRYSVGCIECNCIYDWNFTNRFAFQFHLAGCEPTDSPIARHCDKRAGKPSDLGICRYHPSQLMITGIIRQLCGVNCHATAKRRPDGNTLAGLPKAMRETASQWETSAGAASGDLLLSRGHTLVKNSAAQVGNSSVLDGLYPLGSTGCRRPPCLCVTGCFLSIHADRCSGRVLC